jgi:enoyl-CoA hydratase/carnithine racemase
MSDVIVETGGGVCRIELARPQRKNALTQDMYRLLAQAVSEADQDPLVRAVLLHGAPDCFCAGNDLHDFVAAPQLGDDAPAVRFLHALATADKPLVAAAAGPAVGIGATMLLHCDFVYASPETRLQMPFVALGLTPEAGSSLLLPLAVGHLRAAELLMLGRSVDARRAYEIGIVTAVVPAEQLLSSARETAMTLASMPAEALKQTKRLLKQDLRRDLIGRIRSELRIFGQRLESAETRQAIERFFEKGRAPARPG